MYLSPNGRARCWLAALFFLLVAGVQAQESVTFDFPLKGETPAVMGLSAPPRQVATPDGLGYVELPMRPARKGNEVFLTIVFDEADGKGPAVFWSGDSSGNQVTIAADLAEGVSGLNRRTIELPQEVVAEAGRIYVMGRQDRLLRLRIDWCEPMASFVAADQETPRFVQGGAVKLGRELTGEQAMTPPDVWFGRVLDAALQDGVVELGEDTELVAPLAGAVSEARLRAKFLGLPLGKSVRVWINGKLAGRMQPALPSLTDPGYVRRGGKRAVYAGWREGAVFIEPSLLRSGENSIVFESPGRGVYLSGAALEMQAVVSDMPEEAEAGGSPSPTPVPTPGP